MLELLDRDRTLVAEWMERCRTGETQTTTGDSLIKYIRHLEAEHTTLFEERAALQLEIARRDLLSLVTSERDQRAAAEALADAAYAEVTGDTLSERSAQRRLEALKELAIRTDFEVTQRGPNWGITLYDTSGKTYASDSFENLLDNIAGLVTQVPAKPPRITITDFTPP